MPRPLSAQTRNEQVMKEKASKKLMVTDDPIEKLRLLCLQRGARGILGLGRRGKCVTLFGGVRGTPRNSSACKQQQGRYTNYCCNPYGKAAPHHSSPLSD
ncbi:calcyphosin-like protein [Trichonephila clavipes]|nr:calcyphosin-like protein [Trichonephila clavipes]